MSRRRGRLQLWDWERFETGVPLGLDRCHYAVNAVCRRDGLGLASVMRGLELAGIANDRSTREPCSSAPTYLAVIACRYLAGAELELGDAIAAGIADRSQVMLDALRSWLGLPGDRAPWLSDTPIRTVDAAGEGARTPPSRPLAALVHRRCGAR